MDSMSVELLDGSYHNVDSTSFRLSRRPSLLPRSVKNCQPKILEPLMKLEVVTPEENMGDVIGDSTSVVR